MRHWPILPYRCPHCGHYQDSTATPYADRPPRPQDVSICIECYGLCSRTERGIVVPKELDELHPDSRRECETLITMLKLTKGEGD